MLKTLKVTALFIRLTKCSKYNSNNILSCHLIPFRETRGVRKAIKIPSSSSQIYLLAISLMAEPVTTRSSKRQMANSKARAPVEEGGRNRYSLQKPKTSPMEAEC